MRPTDRFVPIARRRAARGGFSLIELVIVIVITGIVSAVVAVFLVAPIKGYFDSVERAAITDIADTALRRMSRELHLALPNSVRISGTSLEFMQTRTGGRYRAEKGAATDNELDFTAADSSFEILGPPITFVAGDQIVIYNLGEGVVGANAYSGNAAATDNRRLVASFGTTTLAQITSAAALPFDSPNHNFFVVDTPVTYVCTPGVSGTLVRYSGYTAAATQAATPLGSATSVGTLATNVTACDFNYTSGVTERSGLVTISLSITRNNETATLVHQVHLNNAP